jgi:hypothetical protein
MRRKERGLPQLAREREFRLDVEMFFNKLIERNEK